MTTFYHYKPNGVVETTVADSQEEDADFRPGDDATQGRVKRMSAYIASGATFNPAVGVLRRPSGQCWLPQTNSLPQAQLPWPQQQIPHYYWPNHQYDSQSSPSTIASVGWNGVGDSTTISSVGRAYMYPDPETIRHQYTLHGLLPLLQPARRLHSLHEGPTMDIIEQDTGNVLFFQAPKKLLVLFLGRLVVNKFIRTTAREDNELWQGPPTCQEMCLPRGVASKAALRVLFSWMVRACQPHTMNNLEAIRVPNNTFAACSLAQTMELFGLYRDAYRVDLFITKDHFARPIFAVELEALWNCLSKDNKYVYTAIKIVGHRLRLQNNEAVKPMAGLEEILALLERQPDLAKRVRDPLENEKHRPTFGTEWTKNLNSKAPPLDSSQDVDIARINAVSDKPRLAASAKSTRKCAVLRIVDNSRQSSSDAASAATLHPAGEPKKQS